MQIKLKSLVINKLMKRGNFMLCNKKKRCSKYKKQRYSNQVQSYLNCHGFEIVQRIYNGSLSTHGLTEQGVRETLVGIYPIAPWVDEDNIVEQFVSMMEEVGYSFSQDEQGEYSFKDENIYGAIVRNHLKLSGCHILDALSECCKNYDGRITYFQAKLILGTGYPKAPFVNKEDMRACIILVLKETGIPFKFDDSYLYFP